MQYLDNNFFLGIIAGAGATAIMWGILFCRMRRKLAVAHARACDGQRLAELLDALPIPILVKAPDSTIIEFNKAMELHAGIGASEMIGTDGRNHFPIEIVKSGLKQDREVFLSREVLGQEQIFRVADGTQRHVLLYKKPLFDAAGNPRSLICAYVDITKRKFAEAALRESRRRWKFALEGTGDGICDWNIKTGVAIYSAQWKRILGFDEADIGNSIDEWKNLIHADDVMRVTQTLDRYLEGAGGAYANEHRVRCKDGAYKWILLRGMVTDRDQLGHPLQMIGIATDITDARAGEAARAAHMARQRDVLVAEVHHRIKNSLQGVVGLLRQYKCEDVRAAPVIDRAISQVQTISLVHGLQGRAFANEVVLCEMVPSIVRHIETLILSSCGFQIDVDVPKRIRVNEQEAVPVALIINELIINAVKHAAKECSDPCVRIAIGWNQSARQAQVCIRNAGSLSAGFDFVNGKGIGAGLDLVRSLLPPDGACLSFSSDANQVETRLLLSAPSIYRLEV